MKHPIGSVYRIFFLNLLKTMTAVRVEEHRPCLVHRRHSAYDKGADNTRQTMSVLFRFVHGQVRGMYLMFACFVWSSSTGSFIHSLSRFPVTLHGCSFDTPLYKINPMIYHSRGGKNHKHSLTHVIDLMSHY